MLVLGGARHDRLGNLQNVFDMNDKDRSFVLRVIVMALTISALSVVFVLLAGLFNPLVDNNRIFAILTPISQQVTGALISILSGLIAFKAGKKDGDEK